jgi:hypothetical protein
MALFSTKTKSPTISPTSIPQITNYEFVGIGSCLDSQGLIYDRYYTRQFNTNEECEESCVKNDGFRGITIEQSSICNCLYEHGWLYTDVSPLVSQFNVPTSYEGGASSVGGVGEIVSSSGDLNVLCYRYVGQAVSSVTTVTPRIPGRSIFD